MKAAAPFIRTLLIVVLLSSGVGPAFGMKQVFDAESSASATSSDEQPRGHCDTMPDDPDDERIAKDHGNPAGTQHACCGLESPCPHDGSDCSCPAVAPAVPSTAVVTQLVASTSSLAEVRAAPPRHIPSFFLRPPRA